MLKKDIEKRSHTRAPIELDYRLILDDNLFTGKITDISPSGAYLATIKPELQASNIAKQGQLMLKTASDWEMLECEIVYVGRPQEDRFPKGAGVVFCNCDEKTDSIIWNLTFMNLKRG